MTIHAALLVQYQRARRFWCMLLLLSAFATVVLILTSAWALLHGDIVIAIPTAFLAILVGHAGNAAERLYAGISAQANYMELLVAHKQQMQKM